jgi:hypothetical protein
LSSDAPETIEPLAGFRSRCDTIEEAYEFFLAYASQGLPADHAGASGDQARDFLRRCDAALGGLAESLTSSVAQLSVDPAPYRAFIQVIERDARDAQAAVQLVIAQPFIGSALVDNLNASIHLRALLTDLFLIDEALKAHTR